MFANVLISHRYPLRLWLCLEMVEDHQKSNPPPIGETNTKEVETFPVAEELTTQQITTVKFDGNNYLTWSTSVLIYIEGKGKEDYLTGEVEKPDKKKKPKYKRWKTENAMVKGWLLVSMKSEISNHYLVLETATQIWDALAKSYFELEHTTKVYELRQRISQFKQNGQPLTLYYASLQKI